MDHHDAERQVSRRSFFKAAAVVASATLLPVAARSTHAAPQHRENMVGVGLLLPTGTRAQAFAAGWQLAANAPTVVVYGNGVNVRAAATQLLATDGIQLIVAVLGSGQAALLAPLFAQANVPLLVANLGEDMQRPQHHNRWVFQHGLQSWQASWALGTAAAQGGARRFLLALDYVDTGNDLSYSLERGFVAGGGNEVRTLVSDVPGTNRDLATVIAAIRQWQPDAVYAGYHGAAAGRFLAAYREAGLERLPLLGGLGLHDAAQGGWRGAAGWQRGLLHAENRAFVQAYEQNTGLIADGSAALGYDSAGLVNHAAALLDGAKTTPAALLAALEGVAFVGAAGALRMDATTHATVAPVYDYLEGAAKRAVPTVLAAPDAAHPDLRALADGLHSGTLGAYLFV